MSYLDSSNPLKAYYDHGFNLGYAEGFDTEMSGWKESEEDKASREEIQKGWTSEQIEAFEEGRDRGCTQGMLDV